MKISIGMMTQELEASIVNMLLELGQEVPFWKQTQRSVGTDPCTRCYAIFNQ
jgi:hypothetical protein